MSLWLTAEIALLAAIVPCAILILRASGASDWAVAIQMSSLVGILALLMLAQAMRRPSFLDLAVALSLLSFPAGLMFAHFIERWFR